MTDDTNIEIDWGRNFPAKGYGQVVLHQPPPHNIIFYNGSPLQENEVMRITKDGVTANPAFPPDEAADAVLRALDTSIKQLTQRTWVGLDEEEIRQTDHRMVEGAYHYSFKQGAEWAEAKLREKNQ